MFSNGNDHKCLCFLEYDNGFISTDTFGSINFFNEEIHLHSTEEKLLNCSENADSRPPPSKFDWIRGQVFREGSTNTYLLRALDNSTETEFINCVAYDWLGK